MGSIPGSGKYPGEGNGNPLQYSCLENPTDRGAWWATVHGVAKSQTRLSDFTFNTLLSPDLLIWHAFHYGHQTVEGVSESFHLCSVFHFIIHIYLLNQENSLLVLPLSLLALASLFDYLKKKKYTISDFHGGTVDKNFACPCRGHRFDPWSGKIPHAMKQLSLFAELLKPGV